jgi:hypothetical protein
MSIGILYKKSSYLNSTNLDFWMFALGNILANTYFAAYTVIQVSNHNATESKTDDINLLKTKCICFI